uniref:regulatory protein RecX n=1 Tax=Candidatus Limnocylindrus sp. TaxID=2802978 RepID=UPI00404A812A
MARRRDPEAQKARRAAAEASDVLEAAARSLSGAPRSRKSLEERLITAGYPEEHVRAAVARLVEIGLVDDERFAQALLDSRDRSRQRGDRALLQELRRRGIDDELAQRLLAQRAAGESHSPEPVWGATLRVVEEHTEGAEERAARGALSKLRLRGGDARAEVQRLAQGLARRGFPSALSWRLARERVETEAQTPVTEGDPEGE